MKTLSVHIRGWMPEHGYGIHPLELVKKAAIFNPNPSSNMLLQSSDRGCGASRSSGVSRRNRFDAVFSAEEPGFRSFVAHGLPFR
jgi:hypothetical protein